MHLLKHLRATLAVTALCALLVPAARAISVAQFYSIPESKQADFLTDTINEMCAKLQDDVDAKGLKKSPELLKKQKDFAKFIVSIFDKRENGVPVYYVKLSSLIYSASLRDSSTPVENVIIVFATERYKEKLAADAASKQPVAKSN